MSTKVWIQSIAFSACAFAPGAASACPNCALDGGPSSRLWVVIGMLVMPFLLALLLAPIVRSALRRSNDEEESS